MTTIRLKKFNIDTYKPGRSNIKNIKKVVKLSANESALGVSSKVKKIISKKNLCFFRYPDPKSRKLRIEISKKFDLINYTPKKGYMIVADATIIHQSFRMKNSGLRISLDTGFDLKMNKLKSFKKSKIGKFDVKKIRNKETVKKNDFIQIGNKTFFYFPDDLQNKVFHKGGFKHPTNPKLIRLTNK